MPPAKPANRFDAHGGSPFFGRSVFLAFIRLPERRQAALDLLQALNTAHPPLLPPDTEVALVRQVLLINDTGEVTLSPLVESVQFRHLDYDHIKQVSTRAC